MRPSQQPSEDLFVPRSLHISMENKVGTCLKTSSEASKHEAGESALMAVLEGIFEGHAKLAKLPTPWWALFPAGLQYLSLVNPSLWVSVS